jgi:hypothetical protein
MFREMGEARTEDEVRSVPSFGEPEPAPEPLGSHVDEPTREWTYREEGVDIRDAEQLVARREGAPGAPKPARTPHPEEEASGDERSLKELFWGED